MATPEHSTIAQLLYPDLQALDFARIVAELDAVLTHMRGGDVEIAWDCDDMVTFDVPETRILLSWSETGKSGMEGCLTVSVGPNPAAKERIGSIEHEVLCIRLVERIQRRFQPEGVLWSQVAGSVGPDHVDDLMDILPGVGAQNLPPIDNILDSLSRVDLHMADLKSKALHPRSFEVPELSRLAQTPGVEDEVIFLAGPSAVRPTAVPMILIPRSMRSTMARPGFAEVANDGPDLPPLMDAELARLRTALYPLPEAKDEAKAEPEAAYSTQMRLAAHCMNATLILVYAPLGAAMMTYSLLRGEDMRLSSRMMAVAGTLFAVAHTPFGQTMAAMAKGIV